MFKTAVFSILCLFFLGIGSAFAQDLKTTVNDNKELDSLRKKLDNAEDSVVYTSKYVRFTTLRLTKDSIQTFPLDTSLRGIQNFSPLGQPRRPTIGTGNLGLAARDLLFNPRKTIGFDAGFHALDYYAMDHDDVIYYQARSPFTNLSYVNSGLIEQVFKVTHSQNIKRNWNIGVNYNRIGSNGQYTRQRGDDLNGVIFTWYQSPSKRYNLWINAIFNTMKAQENGSTPNDSIFTNKASAISRETEQIRLNNSSQLWRKNSFLIKQSYFLGRIDTVDQEVMKKVLPTNKVTYSFYYNTNSYSFHKDEPDDHSVFPKGIADSVFTSDSTHVTQIKNEFMYSFFLRGKSSSIIKNELKIDAGIRHELYTYEQLTRYRNLTNYYDYNNSFQNTTLLGSLGYRFSNRVNLDVDLQQIFQGRQIGDFMYEAKSNIRLSNSVGRIQLGAYLQNKSPEELYNRYFGNHYSWLNNFDRTKTVNFSFNYFNDRLRLEAGAQYYLTTNYLYFVKDGFSGIKPMQEGASINLLKLTVGKKVSFGKFNLESYVVYQKTDQADILRTPDFYTFNSFFINQTFFKVLKTNVGFDIRYNTAYDGYGYSPAASQFYVDNDAKLKTEPIVDFFLRASLRKANLFIKYDYVNQGLFSKGYYTVKGYPMQDRLFKFGVSWNFYD
jgi:hypothetical protein